MAIVVGPGVSAAAIRAFSVPITEGSSMKIRQARSPFGGADLDQAISADPRAELDEGVEVGVEAAAADEVSAGRRHPRLAEAGEQGAGEQEGGADRAGELLVDGDPGESRRLQADAVVGDPGDLDPEPLEQAELGLGVADPGTSWTITSSSVSREAARIGRAAFLLPAAVISPDSATPPLMTNFSIGKPANQGFGEAQDYRRRTTAGAISLTAPMAAPTRRRLGAFCEWTASDSLRKHALAVEAGMRAYADRYGEDPEPWTVTALVHDLDYERFPDLETGHPRHALEELSARGYPEEIIDAVAGHADFMGVPRETPMAKALYAVDEMSGFVTACALVRPTGIEGMKAKSVRKKMKRRPSPRRWTAISCGGPPRSSG